jgi:hypothetical protein
MNMINYFCAAEELFTATLPALSLGQKSLARKALLRSDKKGEAYASP